MAISKFVSVNGLNLHYLDHGTDGSPALICIHGLTGNAHNFDALAGHLTPRYHVMAVDVRGRGDSGWGSGNDYTPQAYLSDLAGFLEALKIPRVSLIGTSMGGIISMLFAGGYPDRVERIVLNDIGPEVNPAGLARIMSYVTEAPTEFDDIAAVVAYYRATYPPAAKIPEDELQRWVKWSVKPGENGKLHWKLDPHIRRPIRGGSASRPPDMWMPFARIEAPILIVRGADSDVLTRPTVNRMKGVLKNVETVEVPGVGHAPSLGEPEALTALTAFLGIS